MSRLDEIEGRVQAATEGRSWTGRILSRPESLEPHFSRTHFVQSEYGLPVADFRGRLLDERVEFVRCAPDDIRHLLARVQPSEAVLRRATDIWGCTLQDILDVLGAVGQAVEELEAK